MSRSNSPKRRKAFRPFRPPPSGRCATTGKRRWDTRALARQHHKRLLAHGDLEADRLGTYHCPSCGDWHIGHRPKPRRNG